MAAAPSGKKFDIVIFGASGFTGQYVVEEIAKTLGEQPGLTWAVAGRSMTKLQAVLTEAGKQTDQDLESIPILIADIKSQKSLEEMCAEAKIVLNCVGPYQFYGDPVVRACIENKTHHLDISGEPVFLEKVQLLYHAKAKEAGIYILGTCGFDSIPCDMGVAFTKDQFEGDLNEVEAYLKINFGPEGGKGNFGTWQSAIHGFAQKHQLKNIRKTLFPTMLPKSNHRLQRRPVVFKSDEVKSWCLPFVGCDQAVVRRTQYFNVEELKQRPIQFHAYTAVPSLLAVGYLMLLGVIFGLFTLFRVGRTLLEKFPSVLSLGMFSQTGPSRKQIEGTDFSITFVGKGYETKLADTTQQHENPPTKRIVTRVAGPEMGYATTPICMVQAAYTVLKEADKMPSSGGVYTPGAAFVKTSLIDRLNKHQVKFSVVEK